MDILSKFHERVGPNKLVGWNSRKKVPNKQVGWKICKSNRVEKVQVGWGKMLIE